jgi:hypothetical protein
MASKSDALAALGVDRDIAPEPPKSEKPVTSPAEQARRGVETVEPIKEPDDDGPPSGAAGEHAPGEERTSRAEKKGEGPSQAAARTAAAPTTTASPAGEAGPARRRPAGRTAPKGRKDDENGKTRIFVAPHAPDDPGPEASGQDEPPLPPLPLRPQRA